MTTEKLITALMDHFKTHYSYGITHCKLYWEVTDYEKLQVADQFFTDNELWLTDEERELKAEVNKHICEYLMAKEYD